MYLFFKGSRLANLMPYNIMGWQNFEMENVQVEVNLEAASLEERDHQAVFFAEILRVWLLFSIRSPSLAQPSSID